MSQHLQRSASGHLLKNSNGHLVNECVLEPAPCFCPTGLATSYAIMVDGITACTNCSAGNCSTFEDWDGTFQFLSNCRWLALNANYTTWPIGHCFQLDDVDLSVAQIELNTGLCQWVLTLNCFNSSSGNTLWQGIKTTGLTPAGTYTQTDGCSGPSTIEVF